MEHIDFENWVLKLLGKNCEDLQKLREVMKLTYTCPYGPNHLLVRNPLISLTTYLYSYYTYMYQSEIPIYVYVYVSIRPAEAR